MSSDVEEERRLGFDWIESRAVSDELGFGDDIVIEFEFSAIPGFF